MAAIQSPDRVADRADALTASGVNGMRLALVSMPDGPEQARLELFFHNALHLGDIADAVAETPARAGRIFRVRGGTRVLAGSAEGQVHVIAVDRVLENPTCLALTIKPVGDYSTYTLELVWDPAQIDPFFSTLGFKFRPGCFT